MKKHVNPLDEPVQLIMEMENSDGRMSSGNCFCQPTDELFDIQIDVITCSKKAQCIFDFDARNLNWAEPFSDSFEMEGGRDKE